MAGTYRITDALCPDGADPDFKMRIKPKMIFFLGLTHLGSLIGLVLIALNAQWWRVAIEVVVMYQISGFGITAGAHRLWAHRSYKASAPLRFVLMLLNCFAHQGSIYHWCRDHRIHHKFSETDADPHNASRGIFFAHMGWLLVEKHPLVLKKGKELDLSDLRADKIVMFQHKYNAWLSLLISYVLPGMYGQYMYGDYWLGLFAFGFLRHLLILHATWFVNSVAHFYGMRPYDPTIRPAESLLTALCTMGEGWHNWHHSYPFDYAASEYGVLGNWNPTKFFIDICSWMGLVSDRRRATHLWQSKKARLSATKEE